MDELEELKVRIVSMEEALRQDVERSELGQAQHRQLLSRELDALRKAWMVATGTA